MLMVAALLWSGAILSAAEMPSFEMTCVDDRAHGYATFQSHNQKVIATPHGLFMTHIRSRNTEYTAQEWRLLRSTDGGKTFTVTYEASDATNPPVLEAGSDGTVFLARPDFVDHNAYLYRFTETTRFHEPLITTIPNGGMGKFCMMLDTPREQLYYFAHNGAFCTLGLDGTVLDSLQLVQDGEHAVLQYPLLSLGADGTLFAAWTSQKHGVYLYWDIHFMESSDGGKTWKNVGRDALPVPVIADDTGPATRITLDDEFEAHTWLSSFAACNGALHFLYLAQTTPPRQHYMRYSTVTGARDVDIQPRLGGEALETRALDGFFAQDKRRENGPLYCLGSCDGRVACLVTHDNGTTWHDYAVSTDTYNVYSLGGCRAVTQDGYIIGSFTDSSGSNLELDRTSKVYFLKLKAIDAELP